MQHKLMSTPWHSCGCKQLQTHRGLTESMCKKKKDMTCTLCNFDRHLIAFSTQVAYELSSVTDAPRRPVPWIDSCRMIEI